MRRTIRLGCAQKGLGSGGWGAGIRAFRSRECDTRVFSQLPEMGTDSVPTDEGIASQIWEKGATCQKSRKRAIE